MDVLKLLNSRSRNVRPLDSVAYNPVNNTTSSTSSAFDEESDVSREEMLAALNAVEEQIDQNRVDINYDLKKKRQWENAHRDEIKGKSSIEIERMYRDALFQERFGKEENYERLSKLLPEIRDELYNSKRYMTNADILKELNRIKNQQAKHSINTGPYFATLGIQNLLPAVPLNEEILKDLELKNVKALREKTANDRMKTKDNLLNIYRSGKQGEQYVNQLYDDIAKNASYFLAYKDTDKLDLQPNDKMNVISDFLAMQKEDLDTALQSLNRTMQNTVYENTNFLGLMSNAAKGVGTDMVSTLGYLGVALDAMIRGAYGAVADDSTIADGVYNALNSEFAKYLDSAFKYNSLNGGFISDILGTEDLFAKAEALGGVSKSAVVHSYDAENTMGWGSLFNAATLPDAFEMVAPTIAAILTSYGLSATGKLAGSTVQYLTKGSKTLNGLVKGIRASNAMRGIDATVNILGSALEPGTQDASEAIETFLLNAKQTNDSRYQSIATNSVFGNQYEMAMIEQEVQDIIDNGGISILEHGLPAKTTDYDIIKNQVIQKHLNDAELKVRAANETQDTIQMNHDAGKAGLLQLILGTAVNAIDFAGPQKGILDRGIQRLLSKDFSKVASGELDITDLGKVIVKNLDNNKNALKKTVWNASQESIFEGVQEVSESVTGAFASGWGANDYNNYLGVKYDGKTMNEFVGFLSNLCAAADNSLDATFDSERWRDFVYGALGSALGAFNPITAVSHYELNPKTGQYEMKMGKDPNKSMTEYLFTDVWRNPIFEAIYNERRQKEELIKEAEMLQGIIDRNPEQFIGASSILSWNNRVEQTALDGNEFDYYASQQGKDFQFLEILKQIESSALGLAINKKIDTIANMKKGSEEANAYINEARTAKNSAKLYENKSDDEIFQTIQNNAKEMQKMQADIENAKNTIRNAFDTTLDEEVVSQMAFQIVMAPKWEKAAQGYNEQLTGRAAISESSLKDMMQKKTEESRKAEREKRETPRESAHTVLAKSKDRAIHDMILHKENPLEEIVKMSRQLDRELDALANEKDGEGKPVDNTKKIEDIKKKQTALEELSNYFRTDDSQKGNRELAQINEEEKYKEQQEHGFFDSYYDEYDLASLPLMNEETIMNLNPEERLLVFANVNKFSKEQQNVINNAFNSMLVKLGSTKTVEDMLNSASIAWKTAKNAKETYANMAKNPQSLSIYLRNLKLNAINVAMLRHQDELFEKAKNSAASTKSRKEFLDLLKGFTIATKKKFSELVPLSEELKKWIREYEELRAFANDVYNAAKTSDKLTKENRMSLLKLVDEVIGNVDTKQEAIEKIKEALSEKGRFTKEQRDALEQFIGKVEESTLTRETGKTESEKRGGTTEGASTVNMGGAQQKPKTVNTEQPLEKPKPMSTTTVAEKPKTINTGGTVAEKPSLDDVEANIENVEDTLEEIINLRIAVERDGKDSIYLDRLKILYNALAKRVGRSNMEGLLAAKKQQILSNEPNMKLTDKQKKLITNANKEIKEGNAKKKPALTIDDKIKKYLKIKDKDRRKKVREGLLKLFHNDNQFLNAVVAWIAKGKPAKGTYALSKKHYMRYLALVGKTLRNEGTKEEKANLEEINKELEELGLDTNDTDDSNSSNDEETNLAENPPVDDDNEVKRQFDSLSEDLKKKVSAGIEITKTDEDTTDGGNVKVLHPELIGNSMYLYDINSLRKDGILVPFDTSGDSTKSRFWNFITNSMLIDLQAIIDYELADIKKTGQDVHFISVNTKTNNDVFENVTLLAVKYTDEIKRIHDTKLGQPIKTDDGEYLVIGTLGYNNGHKDDSGFVELQNSIRQDADTYFEAHPTERFVVDKTRTTRIKHIDAGRFVKGLNADDIPSSKGRRISELLKDDRNPDMVGTDINDRWDALAWGILMYSKFKVIRNGGIESVTPIVDHATAGSCYVLIKGADGVYYPFYINPVFYSEIEEGALKKRIDKLFDDVTSKDINKRIGAITQLYSYLAFTDESNITCPKNGNTVFITDNGITQAYDLDKIEPLELEKALKAAKFRINVTPAVLLDRTMLKMYDEAGALTTDLGLLRKRNASFSIMPVGADGKPIDENAPKPVVKKRTEDEYVSIHIGNKTYRFFKTKGYWEDLDGKQLDDELATKCSYYLLIEQLEKNGYQPIHDKLGNQIGLFYVISDSKTDPKILIKTHGDVLLLTKEQAEDFLRSQKNKQKAAAAKSKNEFDEYKKKFSTANTVEQLEAEAKRLLEQFEKATDKKAALKDYKKKSDYINKLIAERKKQDAVVGSNVITIGKSGLPQGGYIPINLDGLIPVGEPLNAFDDDEEDNKEDNKKDNKESTSGSANNGEKGLPKQNKKSTFVTVMESNRLLQMKLFKAIRSMRSRKPEMWGDFPTHFDTNEELEEALKKKGISTDSMKADGSNFDDWLKSEIDTDCDKPIVKK